jgi:hypothetical protein
MEAGAIFAAIAAVVAAGAGLLLVVRNARSKGRKSAISEADDLEVELAACREDRLSDRKAIYDLRGKLADAGLEP